MSGAVEANRRRRENRLASLRERSQANDPDRRHPVTGETTAERRKRQRREQDQARRKWRRRG